MKENEDLACEILVLMVCFKNGHQALNQVLVERFEGLRQTFAEVLSHSLDND